MARTWAQDREELVGMGVSLPYIGQLPVAGGWFCTSIDTSGLRGLGHSMSPPTGSVSPIAPSMLQAPAPSCGSHG